MFFSVSIKSTSTTDVKLNHVKILVKLDTSHLVTPFNALWSQNIAHNCDHATFNVDCCYHILQNLLHICMSTNVSANFRAYIAPNRQSVKIL
jgi:hypothetical protein